MPTNYSRNGPPHVFHFAGHGLDKGRGLVLRNREGCAEKVTAEQIVNLLGERVAGRHTQLAFLNACNSSAPGKGPSQPFSGLAAQLIAGRIPMVVGLQTPVEDSEAAALAASFYGALAAGDAVDCAIQTARRGLYLHGGQGAGWAFLSLYVSGKPVPLCAPSGAREHKPSATIMSFGHETQRLRLERFLRRSDPMVIVVHGSQGLGHRHVLRRVRFDLEQAGNVLWRPVAEMRWYMVGEPAVMRLLLAGELAQALDIADSGSQEELEARLAFTIADRCADNRVVVIDLVNVLMLHSQELAEALLTLIHDLWSDLMERASHHRSKLPVFLLASVACPRPLPSAEPNAVRVAETTKRTEETVKHLEEKTRLPGGIRVEVLPRLEDISQTYVADFLEEVLELDPDEADRIAADLVGGGLYDNEAILEGMARELERREGT